MKQLNKNPAINVQVMTEADLPEGDRWELILKPVGDRTTGQRWVIAIHPSGLIFACCLPL
jgi:hypothetical protein